MPALQDQQFATQLAARMSRLPMTPTHRRAVLAVGIGLFFDIYEIFLASTISAVLAEQFHLSKGALPFILGSTFVGMFFGAVVLGRLADRIGRRRAFLFNITLYSVATIVGAFAPSAAFLMVARFFAGAGVGAEHPLGDTYLSDLLPAKDRGRVSTWAYTLSFLGVPAVGFLAYGLTPHAPLGIDGWRWILILGAIGGVLVMWLRRGLPESPRWLASQGRTAEAEQVVTDLERQAGLDQTPLTASELSTVAESAAPLPLGTLGRQPYLKRLIMMIVFQLLQGFGYYGFGTLASTVLVSRGYSVTDSLLYTALTFLGYPIGSLISTPIIARLERKFVIMGSAAVMIIFGLGFALSATPVLIVGLGFLTTVASNVFSNSYHIYQAEIFPTSLRSTAVGATYSLSRLMSGLQAFILIPVLTSGGAPAMFSLVGVIMLVVIGIVAVLGPRTSGRAVEDINPLPA